MNLTNDDLFNEGAWLTLHASLLQDAEYVQMPTADFAKHAATIVSMLVELQRLRDASKTTGEQ
jgi:6-phosphofructokinase